MKLSEEEAGEIVNSLEFKDDLIVGISQDSKDKEVLLVAFMDREAVMKTLTTGFVHLWSRSREELWKKGEKSGNRQRIRRVRVDCDNDALLMQVEPEGPACHKGFRSCFFREIKDGKLKRIMEREFDPDEVYD